MANWKYFTGNLEITGAELPGSAKPALNLSRFKNAPMKLRLLAAQYVQLFFERANFFRQLIDRRTRLLLCPFSNELGAWVQLFWARILPHVAHFQPTFASAKISRQICIQCHAPLGNSEAPRGPARAFGECAQCGCPRCGSSDSSRIPRPRPTADPGSAFVPNDTENASGVQILSRTIPPGCRREKPDNS